MKKNFFLYLGPFAIVIFGLLFLFFFEFENSKLKIKKSGNDNSLSFQKDDNSKEKEENQILSSNKNVKLSTDNKKTNYNSYSIDSLVSNLEDAFNSGDMTELNRIASILFQKGEKAVFSLLDIVKDKNKNFKFRRIVLELIRDIGVPHESANIFISIANDKDENILIRGDAVWALGLTGSEDAIDPLIEFLRDSKCNDRIRKLSATSLGLLNAVKAEDTLIDIVKDDNNTSKIRASAIEAIGKIRGPNSYQVIADSIDNDDWIIQISASKTLSDYGDNHSSKLLQDQLLKELSNDKSSDDAVIKNLIESISSIGSKNSIPILVSILKGNDNYYSALAGQALGEIGDPQVLPEIEIVLNNATEPFQKKLLKSAYTKLADM